MCGPCKKSYNIFNLFTCNELFPWPKLSVRSLICFATKDILLSTPFSQVSSEKSECPFYENLLHLLSVTTYSGNNLVFFTAIFFMIIFDRISSPPAGIFTMLQFFCSFTNTCSGGQGENSHPKNDCIKIKF